MVIPPLNHLDGFGLGRSRENTADFINNQPVPFVIGAGGNVAGGLTVNRKARGS